MLKFWQPINCLNIIFINIYLNSFNEKKLINILILINITTATLVNLKNLTNLQILCSLFTWKLSYFLYRNNIYFYHKLFHRIHHLLYLIAKKTASFFSKILSKKISFPNIIRYIMIRNCTLIIHSYIFFNNLYWKNCIIIIYIEKAIPLLLYFPFFCIIKTQLCLFSEL